jgi:anthranilate phosphoribosyltransferase
VIVLTDLTKKLRAGEELDESAIALACDALLNEETALSERADFLRTLKQKGETPGEIAAFVKVLLRRAIQPELGPSLLDVCGTGGDKAGLFNVSTATMFVTAAAGVRVVKHGNRGVTSKCGGADVLEALGVRVDQPPAEALEAAGCAFLFAPLYHPAFKAIAPVRKALAEEGVTTVFNMLGPLLNPVRPDYQLAGVFNASLLPVYAEVFRLLGRRRAWAVHGAGGLDEVSTLGPSQAFYVEGEEISASEINPVAVGFPTAHLDDLRGGTAAENAAMIVDLLSGKLRGPKRDIVALNASCALVVAGAAGDLPAAVKKVADVLDSGAGLSVLERLRAI